MHTRQVIAGNVAIGGGAPVSVQTMTNTDTRDVSATLAQIRRMAEAIGHRTLRLKRERFGCLELGTLKPGEWRYLTESELTSLRALLGL